MNKSISLLTAIAAVILSTHLCAQDVNTFNGSLNYSAPLLSVPSDKGNPVPLNLSYGGNGISVGQPAGEVGLGWNLSAGGSIIRSVNGIPDDFDGTLFSRTGNAFVNQKGVLNGATSFDILISRRNMDSTQFYFPNYDNYSVSGPGIGGSMTPRLFDYQEFMRDNNGEFNYDPGNGTIVYGPNINNTRVKAQFVFDGDFADTLVSRHYPGTPVDFSTPFKMPNDVVTGDCHNDNTPYFGKHGAGTGGNCEENYNPTTKRLVTANYVEYDTDAYGISSFTITNSAGYVYVYGLPVYSYSTINYMYPLNNDYSVPKYTNLTYPDTKSSSGSNYYVSHTFPGGGNYITEVKEVNKTPVEWKLTSITGPNGYSVSFEYKLWADHFMTRYPAYGYNEVYSLDGKTANYPISDIHKRSGKLATASLNDGQVYYLNSITTSSHKAILVRDFRRDEVSAIPEYDAALNDSLLMSSTGGTVTAWNGHLFDEGGAAATYTSYPTTTYSRTIQLGNINTLVLNFKTFSPGRSNICSPYPSCDWKYDNLHIYAGPDDTYPELTFTYSATSYTAPFNSPPYNTAPNVPTGVDIAIPNFSATAITFKIEKFGISTSYGTNGNYDIEWHAISNKKTPRLNVTRVLLFDNSYTLPAVTSATTSVTDFNLSATTNTSAPLYNETWYQANKTALDANTLRGNVLEYDYSLANKYHRNIDVNQNRTTRMSSPAVIQSSLTVTTNTLLGTGKMTLNRIVPVEYGGTQVYPSLKFDYNKSVSADNPDYDPRKTDYWGYYKSDASSLGYYGYTTNTSKDYTDAWLLRKITQPMGGVTEMEYESNSYTKVIKGNGGFRGASRIFAISDLSTNPGSPLTLSLEEGTALAEDLSAVYNATAAATYTTDVFIPVNQSPSNPLDAGTTITNYFGTMTYTYTGTPLPVVPTNIAFSSDAIVDNSIFKTCTSAGICDPYYNLIATAGYEYTGNGWLRFSMPVGTYTAFGGGSRVKKIINRNGTTDAYTTLYEYEDGVALNEAHRVEYPLAHYADMAGCAVPEKIGGGSDPYDLGPAIGYSKAKIKNLGQVNTAKGWTETQYINSDATELSGVYIDNYKANLSGKSTFTSTAIDATYGGSVTCSRVDTGQVVEYVDKFSPYWGLVKEQRVYDAANNMLTRDVYEYETTEQGAMVENFVFAMTPKHLSSGLHYDVGCHCFTTGFPYACNTFDANNTLYQACIKREYPAVLARTTSYGMGTRSVSQTLKRHEITGEAVISQTTGDNNTSALVIKQPAFSVPTFSVMGPKALNSSNLNILGADAYHYIVSDSTLTTPSGSVSASFSGAAVTVYTNTALVRGYDLSGNTYTNTASTLPYWYNSSSFSWAGDVGSVDTYGLYKKSELSSNPFNFGAPFSSNSKWRFGSEISLMDNKGHTIETRSFNNKFNATKLDFNGKYVIAQAGNCNYRSFTFSGFEHHTTTGMTDGEVKIPTSLCTITSSVAAHTGSYVVAYSGSGLGPNYPVAYGGTGSHGEELGLQRDRVYRASVWTHTASASGARISITLDGSIGGTPSVQTVSMAVTDAKAVTIGAWVLIYADIKVPYNYTSTGGTLNTLIAYLDVQGGGTAWFDDFQLHPVESSTGAKVYDPVTGRITADISADGYATKYTYDAAGRLTAIYREIPGVGLKLVKTHSYNYARGTN